ALRDFHAFGSAYRPPSGSGKTSSSICRIPRRSNCSASGRWPYSSAGACFGAAAASNPITPGHGARGYEVGVPVTWIWFNLTPPAFALPGSSAAAAAPTRAAVASAARALPTRTGVRVVTVAAFRSRVRNVAVEHPDLFELGLVLVDELDVPRVLQ